MQHGALWHTKELNITQSTSVGMHQHVASVPVCEPALRIKVVNF